MIVGLIGMPRRYADYPPIPEWVTLNGIQTWALFILAAGILVTFHRLVPRAQGAAGRARSVGLAVAGMDHRLAAAAAELRPVPVPVPAGWSPYRYETK